jgi:hypothetical protein
VSTGCACAVLQKSFIMEPTAWLFPLLQFSLPNTTIRGITNCLFSRQALMRVARVLIKIAFFIIRKICRYVTARWKQIIFPLLKYTSKKKDTGIFDNLFSFYAVSRALVSCAILVIWYTCTTKIIITGSVSLKLKVHYTDMVTDNILCIQYIS